jgi:hypothetical protein
VRKLWSELGSIAGLLDAVKSIATAKFNYHPPLRHSVKEGLSICVHSEKLIFPAGWPFGVFKSYILWSLSWFTVVTQIPTYLLLHKITILKGRSGLALQTVVIGNLAASKVGLRVPKAYLLVKTQLNLL